MSETPVSGTIHVTVVDEDGETASVAVGPNDYLLLCVGECYQDSVQAYPTTGTHVITVKGRR